MVWGGGGGEDWGMGLVTGEGSCSGGQGVEEIGGMGVGKTKGSGFGFIFIINYFNILNFFFELINFYMDPLMTCGVQSLFT